VMPTMRAASTPSRSVMMNAWSIENNDRFLIENEIQFQYH
jgi:hypothetical protein